MSFGSAGTHVNVGIPGSGLSYRERVGSPPSRASARSSYRELARHQRELEKAQDRLEAQEAHAQLKAALDGFRDVLARRVRDPYYFDRRWASRGPYQPEPFRTPEPAHDAHSAAKAATAAVLVIPWVLVVSVLIAIAVSLGARLHGGLAVAVGVATVAWVVWALQTRRRLAAEWLASRDAELAKDTELLATDHMLRQAASADRWAQQEEQRAEVRTAEAQGDLETLASLLESELSDEDFPIPLVFELEMPSVREVLLELSLPEFDQIPAQRSQLTKTGKLSMRTFAQRDRVELYRDLCAGIALRLVYETFRVLPMVEKVEIFGAAHGVDPASGHERELIALHLRTSRQDLARLDLDAIGPSTALSGLGGVFAHNRKGELSAIPGMIGLLSH